MKRISYLLCGLLLSLSTYHFHRGDAQDINMIKLGWDAIVLLYDKYVGEGKAAPVPVLVFYDPILKFNHMHPVIWSEEIDSDKMSVTPLQELHRAIPDVMYSFAKKNEINPAQCELFYTFGANGDRITINSDQIIVDMLTLEPDFEGRRRIFVKCPGIALEDAPCADDQCKADDVETYNASSENKQYHLAMNAYRHVKGHQIKMNEEKVEKYEEDLEEMELAAFTVTSEATQLYDQDIDSYMEQLEERGKAFGWNEKMMISAKDAAKSRAVKFAEKKVEFDQKNWKLKGRFRRMATFLSADGKKISYVVSTSKFESDIPVKDRDQGLLQWLTNEGTVKNSFRKRVLYLMQADGMQASNDNLMLPQEYDFGV